MFIEGISKKGAFRNFKHLLYKHHLKDKWYEYKKKALYQIAVEWCEEHNINYEEKKTMLNDLKIKKSFNTFSKSLIF